MKIEATSKEIADLILSLQGQQDRKKLDLTINGKTVAKAIHDTLQESGD